MRGLLLCAAFLASTALSGEAWALTKSGPGVAKRGLNVATGPVTPAGGPPGDVVPFTAWWGLRAYSAAQCGGTTQAIRLRRASDNAETNINIQPSDCTLNDSLAVSHCLATNCFVTIAYDQTGNNACGGASCNLVQTTQANQPAFIFNCLGTKPCIQTLNATTMLLASANNFTPATGVASLHYVGGRTTGIAGTVLLASNGVTGGQRLLHTGAANVAWLYGGTSGNFSRPATDGAVHVLTGVADGAASVLYVDGAGGGGTATGNTAAGVPAFGRAAAATTVSTFEGGFVDNVAISQAQAEALNTGARTAYGLP